MKPVMLLICTMLAAALPTGRGVPPHVFTMDARAMEKARAETRRGSARLAPAMDQLRQDATRALRAGPYSVTDKPEEPPSHDKHDYLSLSRYSWPNPNTPNGLPYITKDGQVNPEIDTIPDARNMGRMLGAVRSLSLAYYFTGDEMYAAHAADLLRVWFLDERTRMNPNLNYAQLVKGRDSSGGAVIDGTELPTIVEAVALLEGSPAWSASDERGLRSWFEKYLDWLQTSPYGVREYKTTNNHATWYASQVVLLALYLDRRDLAERMLNEFMGRRLAEQIEPDGRQPLELARTRSWSYSVYNLAAWFRLAELQRHLVSDPSGRTKSVAPSDRSDLFGRLRKALDFLVPYARGEAQWPYKQITKMDVDSLAPILRAAAAAYSEPSYYELAITIEGDKAATDRLNLLIPTP